MLLGYFSSLVPNLVMEYLVFYFLQFLRFHEKTPKNGLNLEVHPNFSPFYDDKTPGTLYTARSEILRTFWISN